MSYTRELQVLQLFPKREEKPKESKSNPVVQKKKAEVMVIETDIVNESKEEKSSSTLLESKKYKATELDKKLVASSLQAFQAFCIAISGEKTSLFLFMGIFPVEILINNILPFLALESDLKTCNALTRVDIPIKLPDIERPVGIFRDYLINVRLKQLLKHIAYNQLPEAEGIIKNNPKLLFLYGPIVKDYSGREIHQYPYQMALMGRDRYVKFKNGVYQSNAKGIDMPTMIEKYFKKLKDGEVEMERQRKMVQPDNFEEIIKQKQAEALKAVTEMFNALAGARAMDEDGLLAECGEALAKFKKHLEPKGIITITTPGYHFDPQILVDGYDLYDGKFVAFGNNWNSAKNLFAWQKVIGLIQRYLTTADAMALAQGPYYIVEEGEEFKRDLKFKYGDGFYYPLADLDSDSGWVLGKNCSAAGGSISVGGSLARAGSRLENLCLAKTSSLRKPMQRPDNQSKTRCGIM